MFAATNGNQCCHMMYFTTKQKCQHVWTTSRSPVNPFAGPNWKHANEQAQSAGKMRRLKGSCVLVWSAGTGPMPQFRPRICIAMRHISFYSRDILVLGPQESSLSLKDFWSTKCSATPVTDEKDWVANFVTWVANWRKLLNWKFWFLWPLRAPDILF